MDPRDFLICDFDQLCTPDPFETILPKTEPKTAVPIELRLSDVSLDNFNYNKERIERIGIDALVYPVSKYLDEDVAPSLMFIPSKVMLFKLMMIGWLYNKENTNSEGDTPS